MQYTFPFEYPIMLQKLEVTAVDYDTCVYEYDPDVFSPDMMCAANPSNKGYNWVRITNCHFILHLGHVQTCLHVICN